MRRSRVALFLLLFGAACSPTERESSLEEGLGGSAGSLNGEGSGGGDGSGGDNAVAAGGGAQSDTEGPTVVEVTPGDGADDVPIGTSVSVLFSEDVDESTVDSESLTVRDQIGGLVDPGSLHVEGGALAVFSPASPLQRGTMYTASVTTDVTDLQGNPLTTPELWSFVTEAASWSTATLIGTDDEDDAYFPQVAVDAAGNAVAVWYQSDGGRDNIWANRYVVGIGWGTATLIETDNEGSARNPQVAVDAAGNAVAVWQQWDEERANIYANHYVVGVGWGVATLIETDDAGGAAIPQVAVDAAGNAVAVWHQSDGTRYNIYANRYVVGIGWGTATLIETDDEGDAYFPQVAVDAAGNTVAVWEQSEGTRSNIYANRYVAGVGWGAATLIETNNVDDAFHPQVAVDVAGNAVAVWRQSDGTRYNIWANRYVVGAGWAVAMLIETDNAGHAYSPQVAVDAAGNAMAVWQQRDGTRDNIWANRYVAGGGWGAATLIETDNAGHAVNSQVAVDAAGNAVAVWRQLDGRYNIYANRYVAGVGWGTATLIETDNADDAGNPQVAVDAAGNAVAVWSQSDGTRTNIWSNHLR